MSTRGVSGAGVRYCGDGIERLRLFVDPGGWWSDLGAGVAIGGGLLALWWALRRWVAAARDLELRGTKIREGDKVVVWFVSGNYDEEVFPDAERFDVGRDPNPHMAFGGGGPHLCLGLHVARIEIAVMLRELLSRLPDLSPAGRPEPLASTFITGVRTMPVSFTPGPRLGPGGF